MAYPSFAENGDSNIARIRRPHLIPSPTFGYSSLALSNDHYRTEVKRFDVALFVLAAGFVLLLFNGGTRFVMGLTPRSDDR